jgi:hypothetical protein
MDYPPLPPPFFVLTLPQRLPSWNAVLGQEHWARKKMKDQIQSDFLSALRATASDSLTRTTCAKNTMLIAADTLVSYRMMLRSKRALKSAKKRSEAKKKSASK